MNQNKLLERQLKQSILELKSNELAVLLKNFELYASAESERAYINKGVRCLECKIAVEGCEGSGYGRNEEEATSNAIKCLFESIISKNFKIEEVKQSLRFVHKPPTRKAPVAPPVNHDETLDLTYQDLMSDVPSINNISMIPKDSGCRCGSTQTIELQAKKIANLEARLKLLGQQNSILKELLLKQLPGSNKQNRNSNNR